MKRVLHLTRDFPPRHCGGISTAVGGLVEALEHSGVRCAVASFDEFRAAGSDPGLRTGTQPGWNGPLLRIDDDSDLGKLADFAQRFAPDLIQLHVDLLWEIAAGLRRQLGTPVLSTIHVGHRQMLRLLAADRPSASLGAQERAFEEADLLVAPTRAAADSILADYPAVADRLQVAGFTVVPVEPAALAGRRLVTVGRFGAVKGTDRLIELLPHLLAHQDLQVDLIGGLPRSPRRDRRWRQRLEQAAGEHRDRLWFHGWLEPQARDRVLSEARALLSVSRMETFGLAALEALARGVPVCGYREPALVETAPGQLWLPEDAPQTVAASILDLLEDRRRCQEMGRAGRESIRPWSAVVDEWCAVYDAAT